MMTIQQRLNRQINERLKTLMAAYKVLGGSFTGNLTMSPMHKRDLHAAEAVEVVEGEVDEAAEPPAPGSSESAAERRRRIRGAVEAALSDIILLGTEEQVRLAERAARDLVAGQVIRTDELVVSLRNHIRKALDLEPVPADLAIPPQGPTRPGSGGGRSRRGEGEGGRGGGCGARSAGGMGIGMGLGGEAAGDDAPPRRGRRGLA